jgi:protein-L-isoaspartate(D-aspartate) O-methyltransferase
VSGRDGRRSGLGPALSFQLSAVSFPARPLLWFALLGVVVAAIACGAGSEPGRSGEVAWAERRDQMVREQVEARGVKDPAVLAAIRSVPRHEFVAPEYRSEAYGDSALPIGDGQTICQPYLVALMTELLEVKAGDRVLEIGTGSGYQAAVLAAMGVEVYSIEIRPGLAERAAATLRRLGYTKALVRCGDGYGGWPGRAPFDGIVVTAAPERIPEPLLEQVRDGGHMVIPVGPFYQDLKVITRTGAGLAERSVMPVRFPVFAGQAQGKG